MMAKQRFELSKLQAILPDVPHFPPDYYKLVLANYVRHEQGTG